LYKFGVKKMYKKIGIISILLLFALMMNTVALPVGEKTVPANSTQVSIVSPISPTATLPDGNYTISVHKNTATKVSYTSVPMPGSRTSVQSVVIYDSQLPKNQQGNLQGTARIKWLHWIRVLIDALDDLT
jgi:hypothetical protein